MPPQIKNKYFNIFLWNGQSVRSRQQQLKSFLHSNPVDVMLLNETWFRNTDNIKFPGYNVERVDRGDGYGGVAVLVSNSLAYTPLSYENVNFNRDIELCGIHLTDLDINVITIYKPPDVRTTRTDWQNILSKFTTRTIVAGDFNAHHRMWGSARDDSLGNVIVDTLEDLNLILLNDGSPTRVTKPGRNQSAVDLSLLSSDLVAKSSWSVLSENLGSDHYMSFITVSQAWSPLLIHPSRKWREEAADWSLYRTSITCSLSINRTYNSPNEKFLSFRENITSAANKSMPVRKPFLPTKARPFWWDSECSRVDSKRKSALEQYRRQSNFTNYCIYKNIEAQAKKNVQTKI